MRLRTLASIGSAIFLSLLASAARAEDRAEPEGWPGSRAGIWHWRLPDAPNGLHPTQSWHAIGSAPDGTIYIGGMDHRTNAALYRLRDGRLDYVGDARTAAEAAQDWQPGETAEKFHTRPLWLDGKVYVATLDSSTVDDAFLSRRGFHWYAFNPLEAAFRDLGVGAAHGGLVALAADQRRHLIYGASVPTMDIVRLDVATGRTIDLGRPATFDRPYLYANRVMWVDARGRLYLTAGNPQFAAADPALYGHVYVWDPASGFGERRDWALAEPRALEAGQCLPQLHRCIFTDDKGHLYRFDDADPASESEPRWSFLGQLPPPNGRYWTWVFDVTADGTSAFVATSSWETSPMLYRIDLGAGTTTPICPLRALDLPFPEHTGYDAWDREGRFYIASFDGDAGRNVIVTRIDPQRLERCE